jgi:ATP-dependent Zn protease
MAMNPLTTAFKNGMARGQTPDQVKHSLLNAGYSQQEIQKAETEISQATKQITSQQPPEKKSLFGGTKKSKPLKTEVKQIQTDKEKSKAPPWLISLIVIILLLIVGIGGYLLYKNLF